MRHLKYFSIFLILFSSCNQNKSSGGGAKSDLKCGSYIVSGVEKTGSYHFCSLVPIKSEYQYKVGEWKFRNESGDLAEGVFEPYKVTIDTIGGCPYSLYIDKVNKDKWSFFDSNGNSTEWTDEQISELEICRLYHKLRAPLKFNN